MKYINVAIDNKSIYTDALYTYTAPDDVNIGAKVTVEFALRKKPIDAYCVEDNVDPNIDLSKIKPISSYEPERSLNTEMIDTALWIRKRYGTKYIDAIKLFSVKGKRFSKNSEKKHEIGYEYDINLTDEQIKATDEITKSIKSNSSDIFLLKGVTGSGKTEVYMQAVYEALRMGKTAIVLLPEIALSSQIRQRFIERFGESNVATLHSKLSTSKRLSEWMRIKRGEAKIVVGARTSVFAPIENIGVIVIDEEHEATYKSDQSPKFDTVEVARIRALSHNAPLVLGSATPSVISYSRAQNGTYKLLELKNRIGNARLPEIEIVDMREELRNGNMGVISRNLASKIEDTVSKGEQVILFLNRRGFSTQIICPDCGYKMMCEDCMISLTYHKSQNAAVCHYCGKKYKLPTKCPNCDSKVMKYVGAGTEKVEKTVRDIWENIRVQRFDLDTVAMGEDVDKILEDFHSRDIDVLVGTQLLAKGIDFANVGLVGIINADTSLNIPDYRSAERTFQLITQVAGRAGRTGGKSSVVVQTYDPDSDVIKYAKDADYSGFYESEMLHRNIMNYPPYSDIIEITVRSKDENISLEYAKKFRDKMTKLKNSPKDAVILRVKEDERVTDGMYKTKFIIKAPIGSRNGYVTAFAKIRETLVKKKIKNCYPEIDINPY